VHFSLDGAAIWRDLGSRLTGLDSFLALHGGQRVRRGFCFFGFGTPAGRDPDGFRGDCPPLLEPFFCGACGRSLRVFGFPNSTPSGPRVHLASVHHEDSGYPRRPISISELATARGRDHSLWHCLYPCRAVVARRNPCWFFPTNDCAAAVGSWRVRSRL